MVIAIKLAKRSFNDTIRNFPAVNFNYTFVSLYDHLLPRRNSLNFYHLQFFPPLPRTRTMYKFIYLNKEKEKREEKGEKGEIVAIYPHNFQNNFKHTNSEFHSRNGEYFQERCIQKAYPINGNKFFLHLQDVGGKIHDKILPPRV